MSQGRGFAKLKTFKQSEIPEHSIKMRGAVFSTNQDQVVSDILSLSQINKRGQKNISNNSSFIFSQFVDILEDDPEGVFQKFANEFIYEVAVQKKEFDIQMKKTIVFKYSGSSNTQKFKCIMEQEKEHLKMGHGMGEYYMIFEWDRFMAYGSPSQKQSYNDFRMWYIQKLNSINNCKPVSYTPGNSLVSTEICNAGTGSVSPVSDIDYTVNLEDPSQLINITFKLHSMIFNIDVSVMFDVNYYGTNFVFTLPGGVIQTKGNEPISASKHPLLKNVKYFFKDQTVRQQYQKQVYYMFPLELQNIFTYYRWNRFAEYSMFNRDIRNVINNIIQKYTVNIQDMPQTQQLSMSQRLKSPSVMMQNKQQYQEKMEQLEDNYYSQETKKQRQPNRTLRKTKQRSLDLTGLTMDQYMSQLQTQYQNWFLINQQIYQKIKNVNIEKKHEKYIMTKDEQYVSKMQQYVEMREKFLNLAYKNDKNAFNLLQQDEKEAQLKIAQKLLKTIISTQIYSREQYYTLSSMLFVQNDKQVVMPSYKEVENAVIDNLGFIVELVDGKKKCVEPYIFIMKISKYLERIYKIMYNKYSNVVSEESFKLFSQLNNLRKQTATLNNNSKNSTKELKEALNAFSSKYNIDYKDNMYHLTILENVIEEVLLQLAQLE